MESDVTQSAAFFKAWAWAETHRKQLLWAAVIVVVAAVVIGFIVSQKHQRQVAASEALSRISSQSAVTGRPADPAEFQKIAEKFAGTDGAQRALLVAGARFFADGKFAESEAQFQKFVREHPGSQFAGVAALGVASALEAQGKVAEATEAYRGIAERRTTDPVAPAARLSLGRLYESQGDLKQALESYRQLSSQPTPLAQEAMMQMQLLLKRNPSLNEPEPAAVGSTNAIAAPDTNATAPNGPIIQLQ